MRRTLLAPLMSAFLLLACQIAAPGGAGLTDGAIEVTTLQAAPGASTATPEAAEVIPDVEATLVEAVKTAEQVLCEASKGQWVAAGETGAFYCASQTRDAGKQCSKKTQCQGVCLARSGTCSPITPLYGCNDVLEKDGREVTLCID